VTASSSRLTACIDDSSPCPAETYIVFQLHHVRCWPRVLSLHRSNGCSGTHILRFLISLCLECVMPALAVDRPGGVVGRLPSGAPRHVLCPCNPPHSSVPLTLSARSTRGILPCLVWLPCTSVRLFLSRHGDQGGQFALLLGRKFANGKMGEQVSVVCAKGQPLFFKVALCLCCLLPYRCVARRVLGCSGALGLVSLGA